MEHIYKNIPTRDGTIMAEASSSWKIDRIDLEGGVFVHVAGAEFPFRGLPTPEAIWSANLVKKTIIESVKLLAMPQSWPFLAAFMIFPKRRALNRMADALARLSQGAMAPYILRPEYMSPSTRELIPFLGGFMAGMGIGAGISATLSEALAHIVEYDAAYRYRLEDMMSETSSQRLCDAPGREIGRLMALFAERDINPAVTSKFRIVANLMRVMLLAPSIRRAFRIAVSSTDIKAMQYDEADTYWCYQRTDYMHMGLSNEERMGLLRDKGWKVPDSFPVN